MGVSGVYVRDSKRGVCVCVSFMAFTNNYIVNVHMLQKRQCTVSYFIVTEM